MSLSIDNTTFIVQWHNNTELPTFNLSPNRFVDEYSYDDEDCDYDISEDLLIKISNRYVVGYCQRSNPDNIEFLEYMSSYIYKPNEITAWRYLTIPEQSIFNYAYSGEPHTSSRDSTLNNSISPETLDRFISIIDDAESGPFPTVAYP